VRRHASAVDLVDEEAEEAVVVDDWPERLMAQIAVVRRCDQPVEQR
jgi:hypothetical protein